MTTNNITAVIEEHEYIFSIETQHFNDETVYLAKPLQPVKPNGFDADFIKLDNKGNLLQPQKTDNAILKEIADAVWRGIKEQKINAHISFNRPL